ncbi:MAG TPA: flippase-like domain-containing protein [Trebonia sp.]|nr:flippase-like domain-containing protein [Trebonia sp.]
MTQPRAIRVNDQLERRIRRPVDALRCVVSCLWIAVILVAAVAASAITSGVETDIVGASKRLPHSLIVVAPSLVLFALFILPIGLAAAQLVRRQVRRLVEAVATGLLAGFAAAVTNAVLLRPAVGRLYYAIIMSHPGVGRVDALDPYLAGLVAYATMIGLTGRAGWRNALGLAIGTYAVVELATARTTVLTILLTLLGGRAIGMAVRYAAGSASHRPSARDIAAALCTEDSPPRAAAAAEDPSAGYVFPVEKPTGSLAVTAIWRVQPSRPDAAGSRHYSVATQDSGQLDVVVYDWDQQAAGTFYQIYRWLRVRGQVSHQAPLSLDRLIERRALLSYAAHDAGVPTPRLRSQVRIGAETVALAYEHSDGITLAQRGLACTDAELARVWDAVTRLHAHHVTHRALTADRMLLRADGRVMLLDPGDGDVAASDLQKRLDLAQLIVELGLLVGPEKSALLAIEKVGADELVAVLPLLQPVALVRSTRHELRRRRDVLPTIRQLLLEAVPGDEVTPVPLARIRPRALVTLVASVAAVYLLAGELAKASIGSLLKSADWRWCLAALALSAVTYAGATLSLTGYVAERLGFVRTTLVQLAGSFVTLVTPAAVGGVALNIRFLQRRKVPPPVAVASVAVSQVVAFVLHILMLTAFAAIAGAGTSKPIRPPTWSYFVVAGLVALAAAVLALPAGRRLVRARLSPTFRQVVPRLVETAQHPRRLAQSLGGALLLSLAYIGCLAASVEAFGHTAPFAKIAVVFLTGSALGSIIPTPGGLGAVETALTVGLTAAGIPSGVAVSAVLLFRLLTFWLPVPFGWAALSFLQRHNDLLALPRGAPRRLHHPGRTGRTVLDEGHPRFVLTAPPDRVSPGQHPGRGLGWPGADRLSDRDPFRGRAGRGRGRRGPQRAQRHGRGDHPRC